MRPLVLNYPQDRETWNLNDQYLVGDNILVAPIVNQGATKRMVYLPAGEWVDFWNNTEYAGQRYVMVDAPLDTLPLFVRKDTIIPWGNKVMHVSDEPEKMMTFKVYGNQGTYCHYQDNGQDFKYQQGEFNEYVINVANDQIEVRLQKHDFKPVYQHIVVETATKHAKFTFDSESDQYRQVETN